MMINDLLSVTLVYWYLFSTRSCFDIGLISLMCLLFIPSQESSESANTTIEDEDVRGRKVETNIYCANYPSVTRATLMHVIKTVSSKLILNKSCL